MQQFWINQDGVQHGPLSLDELKTLGVHADAYVWCTGMPDWLPVSQVPEVAALIVEPQPESEPTIEPQPESEPTDESQPAARQPAEPDVPAVAPPVIPDVPEQPQRFEQTRFGSQTAPQQTQHPAALPPMPPTNLAWAIGAMLLCCVPLGIVAIIYSTKVSTSYYNGDFEAAEHYSEVSAWWCIATIVLGIISQPFVSLLMM